MASPKSTTRPGALRPLGDALRRWDERLARDAGGHRWLGARHSRNRQWAQRDLERGRRRNLTALAVARKRARRAAFSPDNVYARHIPLHGSRIRYRPGVTHAALGTTLHPWSRRR
jgi:hypothetical protein